MSDNIRSITGEPFTPLGEPVPEVIEALNKFLHLAEAGLIRQIHIIGVTTDGGVDRIAKGAGCDLMLVGATAWAMHRLCTSLGHKDVTPPLPEAV